jgi:SAM-dependent methyltransferase
MQMEEAMGRGPAAGEASLEDSIRRAQERLDPTAWMESLSPRKREEAVFHDTCRVGPDGDLDRAEEHQAQHANKKYYATRDVSWEYIQQWIRRESPGRVVLDYCCGEGPAAFLAAEAGAALAVGIDISPQAIEICRQHAKARKFESRTRFMVDDCESTMLPDNSVDRILAFGCLHHLDLSYAFPELRRILKPGGKVFAVEALAYNPVIALYRRMTPHLRTAWEKEHILSLADLKFASRFFDVEHVRYFHLASVLATPFRNSRLFPFAMKVANAVDAVILRIPPISYLSWSFVFELVKREENTPDSVGISA